MALGQSKRQGCLDHFAAAAAEEVQCLRDMGEHDHAEESRKRNLDGVQSV